MPNAPDEIHDILNNLKDGSNGHDNIDAMLAKYVSSILMAHVMSIFLCHLV